MLHLDDDLKLDYDLARGMVGGGSHPSDDYNGRCRMNSIIIEQNERNMAKRVKAAYDQEQKDNVRLFQSLQPKSSLLNSDSNNFMINELRETEKKRHSVDEAIRSSYDNKFKIKL